MSGLRHALFDEIPPKGNFCSYATTHDCSIRSNRAWFTCELRSTYRARASPCDRRGAMDTCLGIQLAVNLQRHRQPLYLEQILTTSLFRTDPQRNRQPLYLEHSIMTTSLNRGLQQVAVRDKDKWPRPSSVVEHQTNLWPDHFSCITAKARQPIVFPCCIYSSAQGGETETTPWCIECGSHADFRLSYTTLESCMLPCPVHAI